MNARYRALRRAATSLLPAIALLVPAAAHGQEPPEDIRSQVDRLMADHAGPDTPGALVAVVRNGEIAFQAAYGMASLAQGVPYAVETPTNIGSTSKQFTAFAIALMADEGRLSLDDDVRAHLPELPDFGETVTLRHLVSHTSGYREFVNALAIGGWRIMEADHLDRDEVLTVVQRQPALQNSPGAEYNYNNTGYALLAMVVERVTGETFGDWMRANVFEPLGMHATVVRSYPGMIVPGRAEGYVPDGDGFREVPDLTIPGPGGIYSTLADLACWMRNLRTAELGGRAVMDTMTTRHVLTNGDTISYAMGLYVTRSRGLRVIQHGGDDLAHRSTFVYYPDLDAGLIVQSNFAGFDRSVPGRIAELFFGEHMEPAQEAAPVVAAMEYDPAGYDPESFDVYAGRYELEIQPGFILAFRRDGERLLTQATGQPAFELVPTSDSTFTLAVAPVSVTFHRDETGRVTGLTLHQNGDHAARRLPDEEQAAHDLSPYPGRYYSAEFEAVYSVEISGDHLLLRHRRLPDQALRHVRDDEFAGTFPIFGLQFERDGQGLVTGFRAGNVRARDILFERMP
jgi:CubicO group peptidase (beta-lactamase class C family)